MDNLYGEGLIGTIKPTVSGVLRKKFLVPPFTVLNAREGWWQERKNAWLALGLEADLGRGERATWSIDPDGYHGPARKVSPGGSPMPAADYAKSKARGDGRGRAFDLTWKSNARVINYYREDGLSDPVEYGTSIFDPVLAELCYTWFSPRGGMVLDPFAGGSVRGIVATALKRQYWGCDLRQEQIDSNERQAAEIVPDDRPTWVCGDSLELMKNSPTADFILSCPPYGDLERYSDDPRDLSNTEFDEFKRRYVEIIGLACEKLRQDRFSCFLVGDFRDRVTGCYRNFVGGTVSAFARGGMKLYNEAILVTMVASLSMRARIPFEKSRKLGKTHQQILVFVKGDPQKATEYIKECEKI